MDRAEIRNKAKNLRTKRLTNSLRRWETKLDTSQHEFQQSQSSWTKVPSLSSIVAEPKESTEEREANDNMQQNHVHKITLHTSYIFIHRWR